MLLLEVPDIGLRKVAFVDDRSSSAAPSLVDDEDLAGLYVASEDRVEAPSQGLGPVDRRDGHSQIGGSARVSDGHMLHWELELVGALEQRSGVARCKPSRGLARKAAALAVENQ